MNMMDNLKDDLALYLMRIEERCKEWGIIGIDSTSLLVRDRSKKEMSIWLSNDPDIDPIIWHPGSQLPDQDRNDDWLLGVLRPSSGNDYRGSCFHALVTYDHVDGHWRSQFTVIDPREFEVVNWSYLPQIEQEGAG